MNIQRIGLVFACTLLVMGVALSFFYRADDATSIVVNKTSDTSIPAVAANSLGGDFTLIDEEGESFSTSMIEGQYPFVFFGFANCPAICPAVLATMTEALNRLSEEEQNKFQPIFITLDPERDTPEVMKEFMGNFHPSFKGLGGTQAEVNAVSDQFKVYFQRIENESEPEDYQLDHSTYIYLMNDDMQVQEIFRMDTEPQELSDDLKKYLN